MRGILTGALGGGDAARVFLRESDDVIVDIALPDAATSTVTGTAAWTEDDDSVAAVGRVVAVGAAAWTEGDDTVAAAGGTGIFGAIAFTEGADGWAAVGVGGTAAAAPPTVFLVVSERVSPSIVVATRISPVITVSATL